VESTESSTKVLFIKDNWNIFKDTLTHFLYFELLNTYTLEFYISFYIL